MNVVTRYYSRRTASAYASLAKGTPLRITGQRHDPCVLDTFIAVVRYMEGATKRPWWQYTAERKRTLAARESSE